MPSWFGKVSCVKTCRKQATASHCASLQVCRCGTVANTYPHQAAHLSVQRGSKQNASLARAAAASSSEPTLSEAPAPSGDGCPPPYQQRRDSGGRQQGLCEVGCWLPQAPLRPVPVSRPSRATLPYCSAAEGVSPTAAAATDGCSAAAACYALSALSFCPAYPGRLPACRWMAAPERSPPLHITSALST